MTSPRKIAFIGGGNMATAILTGILATNEFSPNQIVVSDISSEQRRRISESFGVAVTEDNKEAATQADVILLAVKPQILASVLQELSSVANIATKRIISIVAGVCTQTIATGLQGATAQKSLNTSPVSIVRVMPNTPALIGQGASAIAKGTNASDEDLQFTLSLFRSVGNAVVVPEHLMDAVTGLSGSGPAYVFMIIEAMADAGVRMGLPRQTALDLTVQTILGSALMVQKTGTHPEALKDAVCSPGGTTIAGVYALEKSGIRATLHDAIEQATRRSEELGRQMG